MKIFKEVLILIWGIIVGVVFEKSHGKNKISSLNDNYNKYYDYYQLMNKWLISKEEGKTVACYFKEENIKTIAIYGAGDMANRIVAELQESDIIVKYAIDQNICCTNSDIPKIYGLDDKLPKVDAIVITPFHAFNTISSSLRKCCDYQMLSLQEIIYSL